MPKVNLNLKVEPLMKSKIEYIAKKQGISPADLQRLALLGIIKEYEKQNGNITEVQLSQTSIIF